MRERYRTTRGIWGRHISFAGVIALAVGLLFILPSAVDATPALSLKSPYSGTVYGTVSANYQGCGGTYSWPTSPAFHLSTGHNDVSVQATQPACAATASSTDAYGYTEFVSSSVSLPGGHHSVKARWSATFSIDLVATPGPHSQTAYASSEVYVWGYIYDQTNDTNLDSTHTTYLTNSTSSGSLVKSFSGDKLTTYFNHTFVAGHLYEVIVGFEVYVYLDVSAGTSTASGSVNAGSAGKQAVLLSIST